MTHAYSTAPTEYTSASGPANLARPPACSGAMYSGVPIIASVCVRSDASRFASPKSDTFGAPPAAGSKMFPGFTSR